MSSESDASNEAWRTQLARRLALLTLGLNIAVFTPLIFATSLYRSRNTFIAAAVVLTPFFVWLWRSDIRPRTRSLGIIATFLAIGSVGYATLGFQSAPGVAFAAAVAFSGILLGRRSMLITTAIAAVIVVTIAVMMVHGVIGHPDAIDVSTTLAKPWIRSTVVTLILIVILGVAVTGVVETIENTMVRAESEAERRRHAELQVLQAQSTELIGQLAASLAHDVNNQLTVIASWSELIDADSSDADRRLASAAVSESVDQAAGLTRQLLMLGRRDAPVLEDVELRHVLNESRQMLGTLTHGQIDVDLQADSDAWCRVDPAQLRQVLLNLTVNARDAMPDGGRLTVRAHRRRDSSGTAVGGQIPVGDWAVLSVEDTGVGMDTETQQRAFEPFFTTKPVGHGTGLGLATITVFVEQAAGHIALDTEPGRGTRIELWLPAVDGRPSTAAEAHVADTRLDGVRILLVDDEPRVLDVAGRALADAGAVVTTSHSSAEALAAIGLRSFDVLCSDVVMPGPEVMALIEGFQARNPDGSLLLCSGYVGEELVRRGIEHGRYPVLAKPYRPEALVAAIGGLQRPPPPSRPA